MTHPELVPAIFPEELYAIQSKPVVALNTLWVDTRESEKVLLLKILASVKLDLNHVKVISTQKLDVLQWKDRPDKVVAFGIDAPGLTRHEVIETQGVKIVIASGLADLETDGEAKKKLWGALKQMFQA